MEFINVTNLPFSKRKQSYVKLTYNFGYDQEGNFGRNFDEVSVTINGEYIHSEYKNGYAKNMDLLAIEKAANLGLDFIYYSYS